MPTTTNREASRHRGSVEQQLSRLLDTASLIRVVPHLPPETLHQLIQYRGLDACGELVACATPAQLTSLLDLDLWRHPHAGSDEQFDVDRFGEWLEVLVDAGDSLAARTVAALDPNVVVAGLSRYVRVFDPGIFEPTAQSDDEATERHEAMHEGDVLNIDGPKYGSRGDSIESEVGGYLLRGRRTDAWDAIVTLLVTLDIEQHEYFHAVMRGCRALSNSRPEIGGLDDLLMAPEQHLHDVALGREQRRSSRGYATPGDARAFLQMARQPRDVSAAAAPIASPITTAYFRAIEPLAAATDSAVSSDDLHHSIDNIVALLATAGEMPNRPRALIEAAGEDRTATLTRLRPLMEFVRDHDEPAYLARNGELAFLANTLLAGCSVQSRPFTLREASDAAACICNLGLECWPALETVGEYPDELLVEQDLVSAFEVGWSVLYKDVSLFAADQLIATLNGLRGGDADTRRELGALQRTLTKQREAGTPWLARDAADVLAMLDMTAWISVLGLLDECPVVPAALTAVLERRTTSVSPTAFEFISNTAQIGDIRLFMRTLPGVLSGF